MTCSKEAAHRYNISIQEELKSIIEHFTQNPGKPYVSKYLRDYITTLKLPSDIQAQSLEEKTINPSQINLEKLKELETAVILSSGHNDPSYIQEYSDYANHEKQILSFKTPFGKEKDGRRGISELS